MNDGETREWRRGKVLGLGTFGTVYTATVTEPRAQRFEHFPATMAVKSALGEESLQELENEKHLLKILSNCPSVIRYLGEEDRHIFLELATGGTLAGLIKASPGPLEERVVRHHVGSILTGLRRIHAEGYVHCDLKPDNVLLVEDGSGEVVAKVADFGVAKRSGHSCLCHGVRGTVMYMSPEAARFSLQDKPSDIWALGCVVLQMLGGKLPWEAACYRGTASKVELRRRIATELPVLPLGISPEAAGFLRRCFARTPDNRATADELASHRFLRDDHVVVLVPRQSEDEVHETRVNEKTAGAFWGNPRVVELLERGWGFVSKLGELSSYFLCGFRRVNIALSTFRKSSYEIIRV